MKNGDNNINTVIETEKKCIRIKYATLAVLGVAYMVLPIIIFLISWLKVYIGIPFSLILLVGVFYFIRDRYAKDNGYICVPIRSFVLISVCLLIWVWTTGVGNFFVGEYDSPWRTAIFRDMVQNPWPVIFKKTGNSLVYYLMYWVVPSAVGKIFGWLTARITILLWTYLGVELAFLFIVKLCKINKRGTLWIAAILLFGWGGLNTVGAAISQMIVRGWSNYGLSSGEGFLDFLWNGYSFNYNFRNNNDILVNIYNQGTPIWISTLLFLDNKDNEQYYGLIGLCLLPYAPLPFLGLATLMIGLYVIKVGYVFLRKNNRSVGAQLKRLFSAPNIVSFVTILPIFALYFLTNQTTQTGTGGGLMLMPLSQFDLPRVLATIEFWLLEFGMLCILIFPQYKKKPLYYLCLLCMTMAPLVEFGKRGGRDFCMNFPLPALFILMIMTIEYIKNIVSVSLPNARNVILGVLLVLMVLGPVKDIMGKVDSIIEKRQFPINDDHIYTLEDKQPEDGYENFLVKEPSGTFFYKYLAK